MTIVVNVKRILLALLLTILLGGLGWQSYQVYSFNKWLYGEVGKTEQNTPVSRAILIDTLLGREFVTPTPPGVPAPVQEPVK